MRAVNMSEDGPLQGYQTLKDSVYDVLKKNIIELKYAPGHQLVEAQIVNSLGVSKSPIRDAFLRLEQEGLVHIIPFRGCFVAKATVEDLEELFELREGLEVVCLERYLKDYTDEDLRLLKLMSNRIKNGLRRTDNEIIPGDYLELHKFIILRSNNKMIVKLYFNTIENKLRRYGWMMKNRKERWELSNKEHDHILSHITKGNVRSAVSTLKKHLNSVRNEYLEKLF